MYIDQREPGFENERKNPNWTEKFQNNRINKSTSNSNEYDFSKIERIKKLPESRKDVCFPHTAKLNFGHRMDALKHCVDNKIPFLWWNDIMYDWDGNIIDIGYYDLPIIPV